MEEQLSRRRGPAMQNRTTFKVLASLSCLGGLVGLVSFFVHQGTKRARKEQEFRAKYEAISKEMTEQEVNALLSEYPAERRTHKPMREHPWDVLDASGSHPHPWGKRTLIREAV